MCGVVGFCDTSAEATPPRADRASILASMMERVRHRGPDGDGTFIDDRCALGHLRLKIIDLSDHARQPMQTADGSVVISFNGEIYNFRALRRELERTHTFRSASDTEVLLHGYAEWGDDVFRRLNGMFAVAIWDARRRRLVLARDRLGKKPLFYTWNGDGTIVFGSELKAVLAHPSVHPVVDTDALASYFALGYVPTPTTILRDTYKVPQGAFIAFADGQRTIQPYWELPAAEAAMPEDRALDELDHLLSDAVKIRLESDVPLGFCLSGGVDSTLITALGQRHLGNARTFTIGFRDPAHDEAPHAKQIAAHLRTDHTELYLEPAEFSEFADRAATYFDEPFADSSLIPTYFLSRLIKQHVTVALSGDGGDELFCGYTKYRYFSRARPIMNAPAAVRRVLARVVAAVPKSSARKIGAALAADTVDDLVQWIVSIWKPQDSAALMPGTAMRWEATQLWQTWRRFAARDELSRLMATDIASYLCDDILQKVDRASMASALELRSPLLDYRVVELAMRLPISLKYRRGEQKYLLRRLLERYVPKALWERPKHGFTVPVASWYRGERLQSLRESIATLSAAYPTALAQPTMRGMLEKHLAGDDYGQKLFSLDMLAGWQKAYSA